MSKEREHKFMKLPGFKDPHRNDHGIWGAFEKEAILRVLPTRPRGGTIPLKVRTIFEEICIPAIVPVGYNSKAVTGMVGLENLGATCYLNSLLQVIVILLIALNRFKFAAPRNRCFTT